jgi:hypothetical protein
MWCDVRLKKRKQRPGRFFNSRVADRNEAGEAYRDYVATQERQMSDVEFGTRYTVRARHPGQEETIG